MDTFYVVFSIKRKKPTIIRITMINYMRYTIRYYSCYNGKTD